MQQIPDDDDDNENEKEEAAKVATDETPAVATTTHSKLL